MKIILSILSSINLITVGACDVVACGSNSINLNDQKLVNDVISRLDKQTFDIDENPNGNRTFGDYKSTVLKDIQAKLNDQEKDLVSLPAIDNQKQLSAEKASVIDVHIQSHKIQNDININLNLKHDAQSIANAVNGKIITVFQKKLYQQKEKASDYLSEIQSQILTPSEQKSGYQIPNLQTILANTYIYWPYWNKNTREEFDQNQYNPVNLTIKIGEDVASTSVTLEFQYYQEKELIDDPAQGTYSTPFLIPTNHTTVPGDKKDWDAYQIKTELDSAWGLGNFEQYVTYNPVTLIPGTISSVSLHCNLFIGYRLFWVLPY